MTVLCGYLNTINFVVKDVRGILLIILQKDCVIQTVLYGKHCTVSHLYGCVTLTYGTLTPQ